MREVGDGLNGLLGGSRSKAINVRVYMIRESGCRCSVSCIISVNINAMYDDRIVRWYSCLVCQ